MTTVTELLVQATATLRTASTPDGLVWCKRSECLAEARAIVAAIYGGPLVEALHEAEADMKAVAKMLRAEIRGETDDGLRNLNCAGLVSCIERMHAALAAHEAKS